MSSTAKRARSRCKASGLPIAANKSPRRKTSAGATQLVEKGLTEFRRRGGEIKCNHFLPRRVRGRKYFSARKRASAASALRRAAAFSKKWLRHFFDSFSGHCGSSWTTPLAQSTDTMAPSLRLRVALAAPTITALSRVSPTVAAWLLTPDSSLITAEA